MGLGTIRTQGVPHTHFHSACGMRVGGVVTTRGCLCILRDSLVILMARQSKEYVLWFNFILVSNLIFLCFKLYYDILPYPKTKEDKI